MEGGFFTSIPPGFRFNPKDEELVGFYLKSKVYNRPLPPNLLRDVDLYHYDPHTLTAMNDNALARGVLTEYEWYFFTHRDRRHRNGERPSRTAADGYWKATGKPKSVVSRGQEIGTKRSLVYFRGKPSKGEKTDWLMHEYVLTKSPQRQRLGSHDMQLDDWVLCRVYKSQKNVGQRPKPGTPIEDTTPDKVVVVSNNGNFIPMSTSLAAMPPQPQFYGSLNIRMPHQQQVQQQQLSGVGQSQPLQQQQQFNVVNQTQPVQQQQQLSGVDQSQPLQQQQFSGVDLTDDEEVFLNFTDDELCRLLDFP